MKPPIRLISTDFDGTLHSDFETPPVPKELELLIGELQQRGVSWVINTGRDLPSLMETLAKTGLSIRPDYVVVVEREIHQLQESTYESVREWNDECSRTHSELFEKVRPHLPHIHDWIRSKFRAQVYEDAWSPFCLVAENVRDAEAIHEYLEVYCEKLSDLAVVRNDVYARFSHKAFNKGTALAEIARRLGIHKDEIVACGDHLNDLPMLSNTYARWLVAPVNAIQRVKDTVLLQNGFVSEKRWGHGIAHGLKMILDAAGYKMVPRAATVEAAVDKG